MFNFNPFYRGILPEQVGKKAVPSTVIVSSTVLEAIQRDLSSTGTTSISNMEATIGKGIDLSGKDLVVCPFRSFNLDA